MSSFSPPADSQEPCPLCGDGTPKPRLCGATLAGAREYDLVECGTCSLRFLSPRPDDEAIAAFYCEDYYDFDPHRSEGKGLAFARQLRRFKAKGRFLDVGCATGFFIHGIRRHSDWEVHGTDIGEAALRFAREKLGLDVRQGQLREAAYPDDFFDYVHVNNVLEHVRDPLELLLECRRILKPGGRFFLSVPNGAVDCLDLLEFERREGRAGRSKDGHLFYFSASTLRQLFKTLGFRIRRSKTYGFKRGLRSRGLWPRKEGWREDFSPQPMPVPAAGSGAAAAPRLVAKAQPTVPASRLRPDWYYRFRFLQGELSGLPGLWPHGLDFLFILEKSPLARRQADPPD